MQGMTNIDIDYAKNSVTVNYDPEKAYVTLFTKFVRSQLVILFTTVKAYSYACVFLYKRLRRKERRWLKNKKLDSVMSFI
jgi:hypothetical protein